MEVGGPGERAIGDEVHVWHGVLAADSPKGEPATVPAEDLAVLSREERDRSARLIRASDGARFVAAHAAARRVLGSYLGADPAAIRLGRTPCCRCGSAKHGRPTVEWPVTALSHNLSHSGRHWLLAVALGRPVGVDIECHRSLDVARMSQACLTESENVHLMGLPPDAQLPMFFRCWTRKEAVLKACGVGLAGSMSTVEVQPQHGACALVRHVSGNCPDTWLTQDLPGGTDWSAAVAQPSELAGPVLLRAFPQALT